MSLKPAFRVVGTAVLAAFALAAAAQQTEPMDVVPDKMPNDIPYGTPIALDHAQAAINAAVAESKKRGWKLNVAVVDSGGNLVAFGRMDGAQARLDRDCGAQGARRGDFPPGDQGVSKPEYKPATTTSLPWTA